MASPPDSNSSLRVDEADPPEHSSDPSIAPDHDDISISAAVPSSTLNPSSFPSSTSPASASASRKLPPVPKFLPENSPEGPPPAARPKTAVIDGSLPPFSSDPLLRKLSLLPKFSADDSLPPKSSASFRGLMGPPPVPKFQSSSGEQRSMGPPKASPKPISSSSEETSESAEQSAAEEERAGPAADVSICEGDDAAAAAVEGNGVSAAEGNRRLPLAEDVIKRAHRSAGASSGAGSSGQPPYVKPSWSALPGQPYTMEILKEGNILGVEDVSEKGAYMYGRSERCDFLLEHPTVSRYHAVLQYNAQGDSFLYDLGSTHGTFINKLQVKGREYVPLHVGDIVRFGYSSRLHVFQGPLDLMPKEGLTKQARQAQRLTESAQDRAIREASLVRAKRDAMSADGISWGMQEDAEEEPEENVEEVTWQTFKGELTEKQQKTLGKIHKYNDKLSNLRKENDAIQAKEISQGGLTQGQQTQVARNEQRMEQLVEEVENLEETVNDSIQESISGRTGLRRRGKNNAFEEEDEDDLSDDEFYDRASKGQPRKKEIVQKVETADSLLDQKAALIIEIETLREAIKAEEGKTSSSSQDGEVAKMDVETADPLDQFMTNLSSTILKDNASHLQKEMDSLTKELERVVRLLKLADPTGEGLKKWELKKSTTGNQEAAESLLKESNRILPRREDAQELATPIADVEDKADQNVLCAGGPKTDSNADNSVPSEEDGTVLPGLEPPVRLGAPMPENSEEVKPEVSEKVQEEAVNFITYKERKKAKDSGHQATAATDVVAEEGEGLEVSGTTDVVAEEGKGLEVSGTKPLSIVDSHVADSVALLLRQKRGLAAEDLDPVPIPIASVDEKQHPKKQPSKKRKKQGPAKLSHSIDVDSSEDWVPPAGQTGDGRTTLNDKYGY